MKQIIKEFKEFALKGNMLDLAIGIIIGASFGKIVTSLVNDILMPPIGVLIGGIDFSSFSLVLKEASDNVPAVAINYGLFLNNIIDFLIIALTIFLIIKQINKFKKKEEKKEEEKEENKKSEEVKILEEIRDNIKNINAKKSNNN